MAASINLTAEQRQERARAAGKASHDSPERYVRGVEKRADQLSPEQLQRLTRVILHASKP